MERTVGKYLKSTFIIIVFIIITVFFTSCTKKCTQPVVVEEFCMGTWVTVKAYGDGAKEAVDKVFDRIREIERKMTINSPGGEINELNEKAGSVGVKLSSDTMYVIEKALLYSKQSLGAFDITIGPLVKEWGVYTSNPKVPSEDEIRNLLNLVGYSDLIIDKDNGTAMLRKEGQIVDLGGIAKGYAGDEAVRILKEHGIKSACVDIGGNVVLLGKKPDGSNWLVGVQNPRGVSGSHICILELSDKTIVTSGDYERYFVKDNIKYHHIIDPRTGYPAKSGLLSATIVTEKSIDADALSTAVFVLGLDEGMKLVNSLDGVDAVLITEDKKVYVTDGLKGAFTMDDYSGEYEYVEKR